MSKFIIGLISLAVIAVLGISILNSSSPAGKKGAAESAVLPSDVTQGEVAGETSETTATFNYPPLVEYSESALAQAAENGRPVLMFHATWCPTCRAAVEDFQANADQIPADVTLLRVDFDTQTDLKQKYGIVMQDTFVQVDADGNEITTWNSGGQGISSLLANLK